MHQLPFEKFTPTSPGKLLIWLGAFLLLANFFITNTLFSLENYTLFFLILLGILFWNLEEESKYMTQFGIGWVQNQVYQNFLATRIIIVALILGDGLLIFSILPIESLISNIAN